MKIKFFFVALFFFSGQTASASLFAQSIQYSLDSLIKMPAKQFNNWLISQGKTIEKLNSNLIYLAVYNRLKDQKEISENVLVQFLEESNISNEDKVLLINKIAQYAFDSKALRINLLNIKSYLLPNDSVLLNTYLKLDTEVTEESTRLLKIQHQNYLNIGTFYLNIYHDKPKAEEYFIKVRQYPFYMHENNDMYYFKNLYVLASIGQIKCRQGDYAGLKELDFIPSAFPDIVPTYKMFIEDAGGKCEKCERYFEQSGEKRFRSYLIPIEDKGGQ